MLLVDGGGYATATSAFVEGNQVAAMANHRLVEALSACSGMAGDDASSAEFATSYDVAAREAAAALADLVSSFAGLGELTHATLANHLRAEARSVIGGTPVYDGGTLPGGGCVDVLPYLPPPSLGADSAAIPHHIALVLDHVQGAVWPSADTSRLRQAADGWTRAGEACADLATYSDSAVRGFWGERSPEVPLAVDATHELRGTVRDLAGHYAALASACSSYADQVDARRAEVVALAEWLLEQFVEGVLISVALGCLTGGSGAAAGMAAAIARVAAESPRFARIAEALAAFARTTSEGVRVARESVALSRARLVKFHRANMAMKSEAGEIRLAGRGRTWLAKHEHSGSHTLRLHVGRTRAQLQARLDATGLRRVSTFTNEGTAAREIGRALDAETEQIAQWLRTGGGKLEIDFTADDVLGHCLDRWGHLLDSSSLRVVLVHDLSMPRGFRVLTAFPTP